MANPELIDCPANTWTKVATNVTSGIIHIDLPYLNIEWYQTYRQTGESAPSDLDGANGSARLLKPSDDIDSSTAVDVYVWPRSEDGKVRVDL
jgi:hypothetical protein